MSNTAADATSASTSSFITSLTVNTALAGGELVGFILLRRWIKAIYEPRTYIPPKDNQAPVLGKSILWPIWNIISADPEDIIRKNGIDPYVFVRFLMMMTKAMVPIWLLSWVVLLPIDSAHSTVSGKTGLDKYTFGNVAKDKQSRYWAHLVLDYVFIFWILWLLWGEMQHWLVIRQKHLINPSHSRLAQANTVLITGIPRHYLDEEKLAQLFSHLPGGTKRIWLNRNLKEMPDLYNRRDTATKKLESAQVNLIKKARNHKIETEKKIAKLEAKKKPVPDTLRGPPNPQLLKSKNEHRQGEAEDGQASGPEFTSQDALGRADQLVPRSQRPTTRLKPKWAPFSLGFLGIGQKVDTIDWARKEISTCTAELEKSRDQLQRDIESPGTSDDHYPPLNSAFIHFNQQIAAHMAAQCLTHNQPYCMAQRYTEQSPSNVIWRNLSMNPYERNVRQALSIAATVGLIILWATPVAFVGVLSNVTTLTSTYQWLSWINGTSFGKKLLQGVISGILPPILLALLMQILPVILRELAKFEGIPSKTGVELNLMTRYFIFLVIHTFLIVTLSSGLTSSVKEFANNPGSVATTLASQMPTASTFFITLILTQFTGTMGTLLQIVSLLLYYLRVILFGSTPRSVYRSRYKLQTQNWGTSFPGVTVYAVIMIAYCIISPIINGFGACFFLISALVYKYLFIWVIDQPPNNDTGGAFFPKAVTHVFVGMYIQEICMAALFFLARNEAGNASAVPQGALMVVLIVATAVVHFLLIVSYGPLISSLPLSLAHLSYGMTSEKGHEGSIIGEDYVDGPPAHMNSSKERLTGGQHAGSDGISPQSSHQSPIKPERILTDSSNNDLDGRGERPEDVDLPAERDFAYAENGDDVELGQVGQRSPIDDTAEYASPTSAGPPVTRPRPPSAHSTRSNASVKTEVTFFAVPGGPGVISRQQQNDADDPTAFFHPATKEPQRTVWLPRDELGLCDAEIEVNRRDGVKTSSRAAELNSKGKVEIFGPPPDDL